MENTLKQHITQIASFVTLKSVKNKNAYCFQIKQSKKDKNLFFVNVLEGSLEARKFEYIGYFKDSEVGIWFFSKLDKSSMFYNARLAFNHLIENINQVEKDDRVIVTRKFEKHI